MNNDYYGYVALGEALAHHGVKGQAWGVTNGPPYPLDAAGKASLSDQKKTLGASSSQRSYGINGTRHYGANKKIGNAIKKASTDRTALNKKLLGDKIKGQEDKIRLNKARHMGKTTAQQNKTNEKLQKLEDKQRLNDARHKGSIEFRMRQDSLRRAQMKTELMRQKAEQQKLKNEANKEKLARKAEQDKIKMASKAEQDRIKAQIKASKAEAKANLKLEKEKLRMADKAKARDAKMAEKQQRFEQKQQQKADDRQQRIIVSKGNKNLLNRNDIINSGNPKLLKKYGKYLNNDEYKLATDRIKQVNDLKSAKLQNFIDKGKKIADGAQNVANFTKNAVDTWNNIAKAHNTLTAGKGGKTWKVINTEAPKPPDAQKALENIKNTMIAEQLSKNGEKYTQGLMNQYLGIKNPKDATSSLTGHKELKIKSVTPKAKGESSESSNKPTGNAPKPKENASKPAESRNVSQQTREILKDLAAYRAEQNGGKSSTERVGPPTAKEARQQALDELLKYGRSKGW